MLDLQKPLPTDYKNTFTDIKQKIQQAQYKTLKIVNKSLIDLYWEIGCVISQKKEKAGWGASVVEKLSRDLQKEFPGIKGFSAKNIWRMKQFYVMYYDKQNLSALLREMSWTHNLEIMKCKTDEEREFYIKMSKEHNWSYRLLQHNIDAHTFDRYKNQQTNFDKTLTKEEKQKAALTVKDDYNFDFLGRAEAYLEKELEDILIKNICSFLKELGGYFTFVDRQYRIEVDEKEFFVDLLFYNRELQSLVAIELKTGGFKPEYGSKMNFYLSALNDKVKLPHEKASIGIIICKSKNRTIVDYTLQDVNKPIGIATYNHYKTLKELPERISRYLPSEEELINRFEKVRK